MVQPDDQDTLAQPKSDSAIPIPKKSKKSKHSKKERKQRVSFSKSGKKKKSLKKPKSKKDKHAKRKHSKKMAKLPDVSSASEHELASESDSSEANDNPDQVFALPLCWIYLYHN